MAAAVTTCLSYGGGWQSVCSIVLIKEGGLPRPDLIVIADTGYEVSSTWDYLYNVVQPYLKSTGLKIEIAPHSLARADLYDKSGLTLVPAYTAEGRLAAFCSGEWKRDVCERWLRLQGVKEAEQWIGYSLDELWRVKKDHRLWCHLRFPLIDKMINRAMCGRIIQAAGLPLPKKSRCAICPHQTDEEWQEVRNSPSDWALAVGIDNQIRDRDPEKKGLYLWSGRQPLELATFGGGIESPPRPCETGHCWT